MICRFNTSYGKESVFMRAITEEEEKQIDRHKFDIDNKNIFFYGEVNLNDPLEVQQIADFNLIDKDQKGMIYTRFNYEKGTFDLIDDQVKWGPTSNPIEWFKFKYCLIGKPKRVIVYKGW